VQAGCAAILEDVLEMWTEKMVLQLYRRTEAETEVSALRVRGAKIIGVEERIEFE
jgi:hypothetical protein